MPRSDITLTEQIIASHPRVVGGGELAEIAFMVEDLARLVDSDRPYPRCLERLNKATARRLGERYLRHLPRMAPEAARVTDKMPVNFQHLGLISLLFPRARVIYCRRNPMDNCFSLYFQYLRDFHPYAFDLDHLADYYCRHDRLMDHWRTACPLPIFELVYEDLIADQEGKTREIVAFCGLEWDDGCLRFFQAERPVRTASFWQERQPLYDSSVGRWRNYEKHLGPLSAGLAAHGARIGADGAPGEDAAW